ncbi:MAG: ABC transporter substrate-binding protein [Anaerolineae bacterium]|nr:ABC transporter substrate-binding protein [Anaerolineae bacterium]
MAEHSLPRVLIVVLVLCLVGAPASTIHAQGGGGFPREVIDASGAVVTIPVYPQVIALVGDDPILAAVVETDHIRHVDPTGDPAAVEWAGVGLAVMPELYAAAYPALVGAADAAGVPVFLTGTITSLDGWRAAVERLGQATGRDEQAVNVIRRLDRRLALVGAAVGECSPVRVLVLTPEAYTFGQGALISELIALAGGISVAADAGFDDYRQVDDRLIRRFAPEVVLLSPAWDREAVADFCANPAYADVPAVRAGRVLRLAFSPTLPADPGSALILLAISLHPAEMLQLYNPW